jgi:hypothetical protein
MAELTAEQAYKAGIHDSEAASAHVKELLRRRLIRREAAGERFREELLRLWSARIERGELPPIAEWEKVA